MTNWAKRDGNMLWLSVGIALVSVVLIVSGYPQFLGLACLGVLLTVFGAVRIVRSKGSPAAHANEDMTGWIARRIPWAIGLSVVVIAAAVARGLWGLHDSPGSSVVLFGAAAVASVALVRLVVAMRGLKSGPTSRESKE